MTIINSEEPQLLMRSTALTKRRQLSLRSLLVGTGNAARLGHLLRSWNMQASENELHRVEEVEVGWNYNVEAVLAMSATK